MSTAKRARYGVVIDCGKSREDRGVPAYFDGWYDSRAAADEAAIILQRRSPGAYLYVVIKANPQT